MSGWGKLSFRGKLFSLILLIMAANVVVLLCMGLTNMLDSENKEGGVI